MEWAQYISQPHECLNQVVTEYQPQIIERLEKDCEVWSHTQDQVSG